MLVAVRFPKEESLLIKQYSHNWSICMTGYYLPKIKNMFKAWFIKLYIEIEQGIEIWDGLSWWKQ